MLELNDTNYQSTIDQGGLVLVDFWNTGCVPCMALMPAIIEMESKFPDVKFCKFDTLSVKKRFLIGLRVLGLPTIQLWKDGSKIGELVKEGATPEAIEEMITKSL